MALAHFAQVDAYAICHFPLTKRKDVFFLRNRVQTQTLTNARTRTPMNMCTQPYPYEHIRESELLNPRD